MHTGKQKEFFLSFADSVKMMSNPGGGQDLVQKSPIRQRDDSTSEGQRVEAQPTLTDSDEDIVADAVSDEDDEPDIDSQKKDREERKKHRLDVEQSVRSSKTAEFK